MTSIVRVEFVGCTVMGPRWRSQSGYKPEEWKGWTVAVEGPQLILECREEDRRIEVPKARCVVHWGKPKVEPAKVAEVKRGPGRPPKPREPEAA